MQLEKLAYSIPETLKLLPLSRSKLYRMAGNGEIEIKKVGGRSFITADEIRRVFDGAGEYSKGWQPLRDAARQFPRKP